MVWIRAAFDLLLSLVAFAIVLAALQFLEEAAREFRDERRFNSSGPGVADSGGPAKNTPLSFEEQDGRRR